MEADFKEYPKTLPPYDFWGQIKRTVNGQPVSQEQIDMIVENIRNGLAFSKSDRLLDLACGNGALTRYFLDDCDTIHGVDYSEYLVSVAQQHFSDPARITFFCADVGQYITEELHPERYSKALCYGSFAYFPESTACAVLSALHRRFTNVERVFIGNLPDLKRQTAFYSDGRDHTEELRDFDSKIGIWRDPDELRRLGESCGWHVRITQMPELFYAAHYRFDAILTRQG